MPDIAHESREIVEMEGSFFWILLGEAMTVERGKISEQVFGWFRLEFGE